MFEAALKQYAQLIKGNPAWVSIIFYCILGFGLAAPLFILFNLGGDVIIPVPSNSSLYYNKKSFFLLETKKVFGLETVSIQIKVVEYLTLVSIIIVIASLASWYMRRTALGDALSSIRKRLLGIWELRFEDFSDGSAGRQPLICKIKFGETQARKLRARIYEGSQLEIEGDSAHVAIYVPESGDKPSVIEISFPLECQGINGDKPEQILYWTKMTYVAFDQGKSLLFEGPWYKIINDVPNSRTAGSAKMTPISVA